MVNIIILKYFYVRLFLFCKYCIICLTYANERLALSKGRKGGLNLTNSDLILHFVNKYIAEREKNIILQQQLKQQEQMQDEKTVKTNK